MVAQYGLSDARMFFDIRLVWFVPSRPTLAGVERSPLRMLIAPLKKARFTRAVFGKVQFLVCILRQANGQDKFRRK
jgi:hypothetical protein